MVVTTAYESFRRLAPSPHRKSSDKTLTDLAATCVQTPHPPEAYNQNPFSIIEHVQMKHSSVKNSLLTEGLPPFRRKKPSERQYLSIPRTIASMTLNVMLFKSSRGEKLLIS